VKVPSPVYEVWVDEERFIAVFVYRDMKDARPKVLPGHYRYASHCHYRLGMLPAVPHPWTDYAAPYFSVQRIARDFPNARVVRFDGEARRDVRMRDPYARHSARHG
jgi:hypothetical protein